MDKRQLITAIRELNTTATAEFLEQFEPEELRQYLEQLKGALAKRIHIHVRARSRDEMRVAS